MAPLVAIEFLVSWASLDETDSKLMTRAQLALEVASGAVRAECGWNILTEDLVNTFHPAPFESIWIPTQHLTAVSSVVEDGSPLRVDQYRWSSDGRIARTFGPWDRAVEITYRSGWTVVPDAIRGVVLNVANRLLQTNESGSSGELKSVQETVGGVSLTKTFAVSQGQSSGGLFTPVEVGALAPFKLAYAV